MKKILLILLIPAFASAQVSYQFKEINDVETTNVKDQGKTGTCWSFSTTSFLENEIYRINKKWIDLSEMYFVKYVYQDKAFNYVYRQGNAQFSEGGLSHDVINMVEKYGMVPQQSFTGKATNGNYNHENVFKDFKTYVDQLAKNPKGNITSTWMNDFTTKLDTIFGKSPVNFYADNSPYTPKSFAEEMQIQADNYVTITSFNFLPYNEFVTLSLPDNYSNGKALNLPLNEYMNVIEDALRRGFTLALDADVSEKFFSAKHGMALVPEDENNPAIFKSLVPEKNITEEIRANAFLTFDTTDDHLMHIVGLYSDNYGNKFYKVKNSWGSKNLGNNGYIMMSENYLKYKSISVLLHKDGVNYKFKSQFAKSNKK